MKKSTETPRVTPVAIILVLALVGFAQGQNATTPTPMTTPTLTPTSAPMPTSTPLPVAEILNIQAACICVEEALEALRDELSPQAEPRVITEAPPCPTTNRAAASTVLRVGVSVLASAANVSRALARGATLGDCSSELRLTDVVVSNDAPHTDFKSNAVWAIPCALVGLAMLVAAAMMGLRWLGIGTANRRRKFRDLAEHGSREGSKVDTLSNTSLTSNRGGDHPLQRELLQRSPDSYGLPTVSTRSTTPPHGSVTPPRALVQMSSALSGGSSMSNTPIAGAITPSDVSAYSAGAAATPGHMPPLDSAGASGAGPHVTKPRRTFPDGPMPPRDFQLGDLGRHGPRRYEAAAAPATESGGPKQLAV
jgi:hypothetical protein